MRDSVPRVRAPLKNRARPRQSCRPTPESVEGRVLPSAGALGITVRPEFVDAVKQSAWWGPAPGKPGYTKDSEGWPTSDAQLLLMDLRVNMPWNGPDANAIAPEIGGTYHLSFRGSATVAPPSWNSNFQVVNQSYDPSSNLTTAEMVVPAGASQLVFMDFTETRNPASVTGAGVTDVHVIRPGYDPGTTQVFTTNLLSALGLFGTLRTLDAADVNAYPIMVDGVLNSLDWSERRLPSDASQFDENSGKIGIAWEHIVRLANDTNSDLWITVPGPATDDYVRSLASLLAHGETVDGVFYEPLEPGLKVYLEYSNEVWGGIWNNRLYNIAVAEAEVAAGTTSVNDDGINNPSAWGERRYLERTREIAEIFRSVFGSDPGFEKIRPVLGWQEADWFSGSWQYYRRNLEWFAGVYGSPDQTFYGLGVANYWSPETYVSADAILDSLARGEAANVVSTQKITTIATYFGLKNVAYEGGPGLGSDPRTPEGVNTLAALRDPRMADLVFQHYVNWYAGGGDVGAFYAGPYSIWSAQYPWSAAEQWQAANPSLSPKYRGLQRLADAPPVAVSAGYRVDPEFSSTLPATVDAMARSFRQPSTGSDAYFLLNASAAGTYTLSLSTAAKPGSGKWIDNGGSKPKPGEITGLIQVYLNNQAYGGPVGLRPSALNELADIPLRQGLNTLRLVVIQGGDDTNSPGDPQRNAFAPVSLVIRPTPILRFDLGVKGRAASMAAAQTGLLLLLPEGESSEVSVFDLPNRRRPSRGTEVISRQGR